MESPIAALMASVCSVITGPVISLIRIGWLVAVFPFASVTTHWYCRPTRPAIMLIVQSAFFASALDAFLKLLDPFSANCH